MENQKNLQGFLFYFLFFKNSSQIYEIFKIHSNDQDKGKVEKSQPILEKQNLPAVCFW